MRKSKQHAEAAKKKLEEMKAILLERVKTQPRNAEAWRELTQVKINSLAA